MSITADHTDDCIRSIHLKSKITTEEHHANYSDTDDYRLGSFCFKTKIENLSKNLLITTEDEILTSTHPVIIANKVLILYNRKKSFTNAETISQFNTIISIYIHTCTRA